MAYAIAMSAEPSVILFYGASHQGVTGRSKKCHSGESRNPATSYHRHRIPTSVGAVEALLPIFDILNNQNISGFNIGKSPMQSVPTEQKSLMLESMVTSKVGIQRLTVGFLQGVIVYLLYQASKSDPWTATLQFLFSPLLLVSIFVPILFISSLGHLDRRRTVFWLLLSVVIIGGLGLYDVWRNDPAYALSLAGEYSTGARYPSPLLFVFLSLGYFIAHSLVLSAVQDHTRIAKYATHFELAWKLMIQLAFSAMFVGALWAALWMGATLFMLVKLDFLRQLLEESWFAIPVIVFAFACAMHITDVRPAIVRGIRSLLLVLLSWLLPITTLIVVGFLVSLLVTGLEPLWATRSATAVLLGAAATLVVLINAAFQNGEVGAGLSIVIRLSAKLAAVSLLPIVGIAIYALDLRVTEYGWTTDRIIAAACLLVASFYALGYAWAACQRAGWLTFIAPVNMAAAYVILVVLFGVFSPIADPARISVNSQVDRLLSGVISADKFDFEYLKFEGVRYGRAALERLKNQTQGAQTAVIRDKAEHVLEQKELRYPSEAKASRGEVASNITVWPQKVTLPESFNKQNWATYQNVWELPLCLKRAGVPCDAFLSDVDSDSRPEVFLIGREHTSDSVVLAEDADGGWSVVGHLPDTLTGCASLREKLLAGEFQLIPRRVRDLEIDGQRIEIQQKFFPVQVKCPS